VERRLEYLLQQTQENFKRHGAPEGEFEKEKEKLLPELLQEAKRQVHLAFLLDEIADREKIAVSDEDLKEKYQQTAERVRQPLDAVEKYYAGNEDAREGLKDQIRNEKTVEFLKKNAKQK
jgi:trigger factor